MIDSSANIKKKPVAFLKICTKHWKVKQNRIFNNYTCINILGKIYHLFNDYTIKTINYFEELKTKIADVHLKYI